MLLSDDSFQKNCLCGSAQSYGHCCFPFHSGELYPETAEQLMRSRYVAYAKQLAPYLLQTWCVTERPKEITFDPTIRWTGLTIQGKKKGRKKDREGWVTFTANYQVEFECLQLKERSFFTRNQDGHWCYVNGQFI